MKAIIRCPAFRLPVVMIVGLGWLALSNHCALGGALEGKAGKPMTCHGTPSTKQAPGKHDKPSEVHCCKILRATLLTPAKSIASFDESLFSPYDYFAGLVALPDSSHQNGIFEWDTGPPGGDSFAESVLQRSLLAHAPPFSLS